MKRVLCLILCVLLLTSSAFALTLEETAESGTDDVWGDYEVWNDGSMYLTANFPSVYPSDEEYYEKETDAVIEQKIDAIMATLTKSEMLDMLSGDGSMADFDYDVYKNYGTGYWKGIARLGVPILRMYDGPMGVRGNSGQETAKPNSNLSIASSFNKAIAYDLGTVYAADEKANSGNVQLGLQVDLIRYPTFSRAYDDYSEDWYLTSVMSSAMSEALQDNNILACLKHLGTYGYVDEQTLYESYLYPYIYNSDQETASVIMTKDNGVNGAGYRDYYLHTESLRNIIGFDGIVLSDWGIEGFSADVGLTMETPTATYDTPEAILAAIEAGDMTWDDVERQCRYILEALGDIGMLNLVKISRDGTAAEDADAPPAIELSDLVTGEQRYAINEANDAIIEDAGVEGAVLLKNEDATLPLSGDDPIVLIGPGSTAVMGGHMHENGFGWLPSLATSVYDALGEYMPGAEIEAYPYQDGLGEAIPAEYLYTDAAGTENGVLWTGTDGDGNAVDTVAADIDFVTNSQTYKNAEDGTAFPYGEQGVEYTFTTYLKAPESGTYQIKLETIGATSASAYIMRDDGREQEISTGLGNSGVGGFGNENVYVSDTGLAIPHTGEKQLSGFAALFAMMNASSEASGEGEEELETTTTYELVAGHTYKITITVSGAIADSADYMRGVKDTQVRLAWITPSEAEASVNDALAAAATPGRDVVIVVCGEGESQMGMNLTDLNTIGNTGYQFDYYEMLDSCIEAAESAGNRITLLLSTSGAVEINQYVDRVDAILDIWQAGQSMGSVAARLLSGADNPSGHLSITWPKDFSMTQSSIMTDSSDLSEGIFIGYKWYDANTTYNHDDAVLWDFGYGLSYTDFSYELTDVVPSAAGDDAYGYDFYVTVTNTGDCAGKAVSQIYIGAAELENGVYTPEEVMASFERQEYNTEQDYGVTAGLDGYFPTIDGVQQAEKQLCGFEKTALLQPGESETLVIHVDERALSYWDANGEYHTNDDGTYDKWTVIEGERTFYIAQSSDDENAIVKTVAVEAAPSTIAFGVDAPEAAASDEPFTVTITTGADVDSIRLTTDSGESVLLEGRTVDYSATENVYTLTLRLDADTVFVVNATDMLGTTFELGRFAVRVK